MAGKKKEGIGSLKETTGGSRRDDRLIISKYTFEEISINTKNALTVIYMLKSPEDSVVLRVSRGHCFSCNLFLPPPPPPPPRSRSLKN